MPHYILELLTALAQMPMGHSFVSIYESGSDDSTGRALSTGFFHDVLPCPSALDSHVDLDVVYLYCGLC